jgi:hypothetical protein
MQSRKLSLALTLAILGVLFLAGCGRLGGNPTYGDVEPPLTGPAYLVCGTTCSAQAQCGQAQPAGQDTFPAVLINASGPATQNQSNWASTNSEVTILASEPQTMQYLSGENAGSQFSLTYYRVSVTSLDNREFWVPGWCIADQSVN